MQARLAFEHGKRVWLLRSLVTDQDWARKMIDQGKAVEVASVDDVIADIMSGAPAPRPPHSGPDQPEQLALTL
jgi:DNA processing protein